MNKKTRKKQVALLTILAMVICTMFCTNTAKAETSTETKKTISCTVNGVKRTLTWSNDGSIYFKNGDSESIRLIPDSSLFLSIKFDTYGTCWTYTNDHFYENKNEYFLRWWNYDLLPNSYAFNPIPRLTSEGYYESVNDVESLILDSDNYYWIQDIFRKRICYTNTRGYEKNIINR